MEFVFNERKSAQIAAYFLRLHGQAMPYRKLVKLLYLADRQALIETGYPSTGDRLVALPDGPALGRLLQLLGGATCPPDSCWREYVSAPIDGCVAPLGDGDFERMSRYERSLAAETLERFGVMSFKELAAHTQQLPEWRKPPDGERPIDPILILRSAGLGDEDIAEAKRLAEMARDIQPLLAR